MHEVSITPSLVIEYLYCPRFIYFMKVLNIPQNEESRYKVQKGREIHKFKELSNIDYLRKKIKVTNKWKEQELYSDKYSIHGKIDEVLEFEDGSMGVLDYKFAEFKNKIFSTYKTQLIMYSLMVEDNFDREVNRAYIVYTRSKNHIEEIKITKSGREKVKLVINNIIEILTKGYFPSGTNSQSKCNDCCYRNICRV